MPPRDRVSANSPSLGRRYIDTASQHAGVKSVLARPLLFERAKHSALRNIKRRRIQTAQSDLRITVPIFLGVNNFHLNFTRPDF
jgi:hypothetical protein